MVKISNGDLSGVGKPIFFAIDAHFTKLQGCWTMFFYQDLYHSPCLEHMNTLHIQMSKAPVPKLKQFCFHWSLHQFGRICFPYFQKIDFVHVALVYTITTAWLSLDFRMYFCRVKWTFKAFHTNFLTKNKLACNLGRWIASLIWIRFILFFTIDSNKINITPIFWAIL